MEGRGFRAAQVTASCPPSPTPDCSTSQHLPGHPINKCHGRGWAEQPVKHRALTPRLAQLAHSVPKQPSTICLGVQKVLVCPGRKGAWVASVGTGNPFLSHTSLCFLWISLTFHSWPDLCFHTDFCTPAFPSSSSSLLRCCGTTPAKKAGRAFWHPAAQSQNNPCRETSCSGVWQEERKMPCVLCCCAPGLSSQHAAPAHPWDPRWAACDGQALEQLIWDPRDTSKAEMEILLQRSCLVSPRLQHSPGLVFPCRQGKESVSSSVLSPPKHPGIAQQAAPCQQRASLAPQARGAAPSEAIRGRRA